MRLLRSRPGETGGRRGAVLLLAVLVLVVLIIIAAQLKISTLTDARVTRNGVGLSTMEMAARSALRQVEEDLLADAEEDAGAEEGGAPGGAGAGLPSFGGLAGGDEGMGENKPPSDSREDAWAQVSRTEINGIGLRILTRDEDSKYNVLNMLQEDEEEAEAAYQRVVRILDLCREGTDHDLARRDAEQIASAMRAHMLDRETSTLPRPRLLTDDPEGSNEGFPLSLAEMASLPEVPDVLFKSFRDERDQFVHSIETFLTVWSSVGLRSDLGAVDQAPGVTGPAGGGGSSANTDSEATPPGGYAVNVNTAPPVVLKGLFDDRDVPMQFWDDLIEYRNLQDEDAMDADAEPQYDEFGEEEFPRQIFDDLEELSEVRGWNDFDEELKQKIRSLLVVRSNVFSILVTARRSTANDESGEEYFSARERARAEEDSSAALVFNVRSVVWRHKLDDEFVITPLVRWDVLNSVPHEVLDYPEEEY